MLFASVKNTYILIVLVCISIFAYANILNTPFFSDDFNVLYRLQHTGFNAGAFFRPLSDASIYLDYLLWNTHALWFHISSVLIHAITCFLVYLISIEIFNGTSVDKSRLRLYAFISAVLFLVYPFHNEAVVWIVGRGVLLATALSLSALLTYLKAGGRFLYLLLSAACYFIALFAYESPVLLPVTICIFQWIRKKEVKPSLVVLSFFGIAFLTYYFIRVHYLGSFVGADDYFGLHISLKHLVLNLCRLAERSLLPPMADYVHAMVLAVLLFAGAVAIYLKKSKLADRYFPLFTFIFIVALLPVITLGIDTHDTEGERYLYFPSVFLIIAIVFWMHIVFRQLRKMLLCFFGIFLYFISFLIISNQNWHNAGKIIQRITGNAAQFNSAGNVYIIDLPDNLNGAYIFRNGFKEALLMLQKPVTTGKIIVLSRLDLHNETAQNDYASSTLGYSGERFVIAKYSTGSAIRITDTKEHKDYITKPEDKILFFSKGIFRQIK